MEYLADFGGLKLREVTELDRPTLEDWIAADPAHASLMEPDFFMGLDLDESGELAKDPRATCYAIEDATGTVFYVRLSRAARVNIQFPPSSEINKDPRRISAALMLGMAFLEVGLSRAGAEEWIFQSMSPRLRRLAERTLGFVSSSDEMVRPIGPPDRQEIALHAEQQGKGGRL